MAPDVSTIAWDETKSQNFANRFVANLNEAAIMMMISIGHRTALFDAMDGQDWQSSRQIAQAANLHERYVREWLGAMVVGQIIDYCADTQTYQLPPEHARWLTRRVSPDNLAVTAQWISVLGHVESDVVDKFKHGGGVPYQCFHRFHEVMASESAQTVVAALHDHILPLSPNLAHQLETGIDVLDIGCGSGKAVCALAQAFPQSRFVGYDLCDDAIAAAHVNARGQALSNVNFQVQDLTTLNESERYDLVTAFDVIHDQKEPATVLGHVHAALKPGGTFLMQDIAGSSHLEKNMDHPVGALNYTISTMHCMTVSLAQGGQGLGTMWGEELATQMLRDAGFDNIEKEKLAHDFMNVYYVMNKR